MDNKILTKILEAKALSRKCNNDFSRMIFWASVPTYPRFMIGDLPNEIRKDIKGIIRAYTMNGFFAQDKGNNPNESRYTITEKGLKKKQAVLNSISAACESVSFALIRNSDLPR